MTRTADRPEKGRNLGVKKKSKEKKKNKKGVVFAKGGSEAPARFEKKGARSRGPQGGRLMKGKKVKGETTKKKHFFSQTIEPRGKMLF